MSQEKAIRLRKEGPIERPGPSFIIVSGPDEKGRRRHWESLDD